MRTAAANTPQTSRILVTGGAGYIGAFVAAQLQDAGAEVVILDNLSSGNRRAIPSGAIFAHADIGDRKRLTTIIDRHHISAVLHFAAHIEVAESVAKPLRYYRNNLAGTLTLLETCAAAGVKRVVFSSSAAVYGAPQRSPVAEDAPTTPINPYGRSKLMCEWLLRDAAAADPEFRFVALRYFNVAGARADHSLGQATPNATHLIKLACQAACGLRAEMRVFGDDYPTADGTCIRDYIHVEDLAQAHLTALAHLTAGGDNLTLNCGYGHGYSVHQVLDCVRQVSGVDFPIQTAPRRRGDPPELVADNTRILKLGWQPQYDDLETICRSAFHWEQALQERGG